MNYIEFYGGLCIIPDKVISFEVVVDKLYFRFVDGYEQKIRFDSNEEAKKEYRRIRKIISSI